MHELRFRELRIPPDIPGRDRGGKPGTGGDIRTFAARRGPIDDAGGRVAQGRAFRVGTGLSSDDSATPTDALAFAAALRQGAGL